MSQEQKDKISKSTSGKNHWFYGRNMSEEQKQKISNTLKGATHGFKKGSTSLMKGRHHTEETKKQISESKKGKPCSSSTKFKLGNKPWNTGKKRSKKFVQEMKERIASLNNYRGGLGAQPHRDCIKNLSEILREYSDDVQIEKRVVMQTGNWRYIDVLVNGNMCYEVGYCEKDKKRELKNNGYEVIHLPYSMLGGWL